MQTEARTCWRELCPFHPATQCVYRLQLFLPMFKVKRWNDLWKDDVLDALAKTLNLDASKLDIPDPLIKKGDKVQAMVHIRVAKSSENGASVCPNIFDLTSSPIADKAKFNELRDKFIENLHLLNSKICGSWEWVQNDNTALAEERPGKDFSYANRLEINIRPMILRRQERKNGGKVGGNVVPRKDRRNNQSIFTKWTELVIHRKNFTKALLYSTLLFVLAVSLFCYFRAKLDEHRKKLESPRSDINGYKYYSPSSKSEE